MTYRLLLVDADGVATTPQLIIRQQREFPGSPGLSVHFRPVEMTYCSSLRRSPARILTGEGIVRSQLWVEYEVLGPHINVTGRSSDLLFALALITSKWKKADGRYPAIAATGVLDAESAALASKATAAVRSVKHTAEKVAAAVLSLIEDPEALIFYPAADVESVEVWSASAYIPAHIRLHPVESLEDALSVLGISLEKVYLGNPFRGLTSIISIGRFSLEGMPRSANCWSNCCAEKPRELREFSSTGRAEAVRAPFCGPACYRPWYIPARNRRISSRHFDSARSMMQSDVRSGARGCCRQPG